MGLSCNAMGSPMYPDGTNHLSPYSALFKNEQSQSYIALFASDELIKAGYVTGRSIMITDLGLATMASILIYFGYVYGFVSVLMYYIIPYMVCTHVSIMHCARMLTVAPFSYAITGKRSCAFQDSYNSLRRTRATPSGLVSSFPATIMAPDTYRGDCSHVYLPSPL